jgi:F-type H+-transporting ATPase subunit b
MLDINPGLILWTIITFLIVLLILRAIAWKPLVGVLTAREEKIRAALEESENAQREARKLLEENKRQMTQADEQAQRVMKEGREMGEKLKAEIVEKAHQTARSMVDQAKEEIQREKEAALIQLRTEVADLAIGAAEKLLDANLDTPKQRQIVDGIIKDIKKN